MMARKATVEGLLKDERVFEAAKNSALYGVVEICNYAILADKPTNFLLDAYVRNMFPYYRTRKQPDPKAKAAPVPAVQKFWNEASLIGCYKFGELEMHVLTICDQMPQQLILKLYQMYDERGKHNSNLNQILKKEKKDDFTYNSLKEMIDKGHKKLLGLFEIKSKS